MIFEHAYALLRDTFDNAGNAAGMEFNNVGNGIAAKAYERITGRGTTVFGIDEDTPLETIAAIIDEVKKNLDANKPVMLGSKEYAGAVEGWSAAHVYVIDKIVDNDMYLIDPLRSLAIDKEVPLTVFEKGVTRVTFCD